MTNGETILDALALLPDDLLEATDALRCRKRTHWKQWAALAACLCLAVGLWLLAPGIATDNSKGMAADGALSNSIEQESGSASYLTATVIAVSDDYVKVMLGEKLPEDSVGSTTHTTVISLVQLEEIPDLTEGQFIRIYCDEMPDTGTKTEVLTPYRIEIVEE